MGKKEASKEIKAAKKGYEKHLSENIKTNSKAFCNYVQSKTKTRNQWEIWLMIMGRLCQKASNQRTNVPVNAHLISWPSKAQNIQNPENI